MKILLLTILLFIFSVTIFSQTEKKKIVVSLSPSKMKERIIKQDFPDVPKEIRKYHAIGKWSFRIFVDENGEVRKAETLSKYPNFLTEYIEKALIDWKFEPLTVDKEKVSFTGVLYIPFCYGSFSSWCLD